MIQFFNLYSQITTDDGVLIIEDIQCRDWIGILKNEVPEDVKTIIKMHALHIQSGHVQAAHTNTAHTHTDVHATHMHTQSGYTNTAHTHTDVHATHMHTQSQ
jgi:hypothetical protein